MLYFTQSLWYMLYASSSCQPASWHFESSAIAWKSLNVFISALGQLVSPGSLFQSMLADNAFTVRWTMTDLFKSAESTTQSCSLCVHRITHAHKPSRAQRDTFSLGPPGQSQCAQGRVEHQKVRGPDTDFFIYHPQIIVLRDCPSKEKSNEANNFLVTSGYATA